MHMQQHSASIIHHSADIGPLFQVVFPFFDSIPTRQPDSTTEAQADQPVWEAPQAVVQLAFPFYMTMMRAEPMSTAMLDGGNTTQPLPGGRVGLRQSRVRNRTN